MKSSSQPMASSDTTSEPAMTREYRAGQVRRSKTPEAAKAGVGGDDGGRDQLYQRGPQAGEYQRRGERYPQLPQALEWRHAQRFAASHS